MKRIRTITIYRVPVAVAVLSIGISFFLSACASIQPKHRRDVAFNVITTHDEFQLAAKHVMENNGGELVERPTFTPRSADISDISRRSLSGTYVGYTAGTHGALFDSVFFQTLSNDSIEVSIHSYYPLITAVALSQELEHPMPVMSGADRLKTDMPMSVKSKFLFQALTLITPSLGNTYLYADNPLVADVNVTPEVIFPLLVDAGFAFFLLKELDNPTKTGTYIFGTVAISVRIAGIIGLSAGIDQYNILARSGYDLSLPSLQDFRTHITMDVPIP